MNEAIRKEIIGLLSKTATILEVKEEKDIEELKVLSEQAVEGVALHKDLDLISVTVMIYSIYKIANCIVPKDYQTILEELRAAKKFLEQKSLGRYNKAIKSLFTVIKKCNAKVKVHLADVMHAARIKKGASLLQRGLSLGQAAGLMGLTNWDLQQYIGKTTTFETHREATPAKKRLALALKIFGA